MPGERTEQATQHRRDKARREGDILHSRELASAAGALAGVIALGALGGRILEAWRGAFQEFLRLGSPAQWEPATIEPTLFAARRLAIGVLAAPAVVMAVVATSALLAGLVQTGGISFHAGAIQFKLDRVNPVSNIKNLFSLRAAARLLKSLLPASLLAVFAVQRIARQLTIPPFSTARIQLLGSEVYGLLLAAAWLLFGWSAVDYLVEWQSRESRLKMSREDMRDEYKETEGSPQIRSRIRGLQRQMRRRRVKADVSKATVVLTNPTHYAVALGFDFSSMEAATCWPRRSRPRLAGPACRSSRTRRWPVPSTARSRSARRFPLSSMRRWPRFSPISTASAWKPNCGSAAPVKRRRAPRPLQALRLSREVLDEVLCECSL